MIKVSNLKIELQKGTTNNYYASWGFSVPKEESNTSIKVGSLVSIKASAKYYATGQTIPDWVKKDRWYVDRIDKHSNGDEALLNKNYSGTNAIRSLVYTKDLTINGSSSSESGITKDTLDKFEVTWYYDTGGDIWFEGGKTPVDGTDAEDNINVRSGTYSPPDNASIIKVVVKPVAKNKEGENPAPHWAGTQAVCKYNIGTLSAPDVPPTPSVEIKQYTLTATVDKIDDSRTHEIEFEITNIADGVKIINGKDSGRYVKVSTCRASYSCAVTAGGEYRVRCRAIHLNGSTKIPSEWTAYSEINKTIPSTPSGITVCRANSKTSVYLEWKAEPTATKYDIEYTTNKNYFDGSDQTSKKEDIEFTHFEVTGLESGKEYFFRIRAKNEKGESGWSGIKSVVIGTAPGAPTTWSSSTTVITGEELTLYWVHNSEDNSNQTLAELELKVSNSGETIYERAYMLEQNENIEDDYIKYVALGEVEEDEEEENWSCDIKTGKFVEGVKIEWCVRTKGIINEFGDWSVKRAVDIYAPPTLELDIITSEGTSIDTVTAFPFYVDALAGPSTQVPIGYQLTVTANESYETIDRVGNTVFINSGDVIYSKHFDINNTISIEDINRDVMVEFSANNIDLENGVGYLVNCTVSMDSGLSTQASIPFDVSWADELYEPNVSMVIDDNTYSAQIRPFCRDRNGALVEDVMLSVYRREFDGGYTEIASNLDNTKNAVVVDPHPPLDYARYRIVATTKSTGAVSFYDPPAYPVDGKSIIIQWDEDWQSFDSINATAESQEEWSGSLLKLHYNIDVSDNNSPDVSFVKYVGRTHPVGYYGTQLGATATWNTVIEKDDEETIFALRRLSQWMGDVYVREPSGTGYWANIKVSFSQKHKDLTIPVTLDITRVEGGI